MARTDLIRAAGVVLLRDVDGAAEALIVHRPTRRDWSLPKGKVDEGEHLIEAAVRECDEETGYTPILRVPLATQQYSVMSRPKVVNYWLADIGVQEGFAPDDEIDEVRWVPVADVEQYLTYPADVALVRQAVGIPPTVPLILLRHTQAMKRVDFSGEDDHDRPLSGRGRSQAKQLVPLIDAFGVAAVHSSTARRCSETVRRVAKHLDTKVVGEPALTEESHRDHPNRAAKRARELAVVTEPIVVCLHRPVLPSVLDAVADALGLDVASSDWVKVWDPKLPPGAFIVIHRSFDTDGSARVVGVERHTVSRE